METIPIFSSFISVNRETNIDVDILDKAARKIFKTTNNQQYHFNGTEKEFEPMFELITHSVHNVWINTINGNDDFQVCLSDIWMSIGSDKNILQPHQHPHQSLSGVFYIKSKDSKLTFLSPVAQVIDKYPQTVNDNCLREFNQYNSSVWSIPCEVGAIVIFPSYLFHYVQNHDGDDRISVAFDVKIERK
jgi:uncharacterized protein (TIGR02466 family)